MAGMGNQLDGLLAKMSLTLGFTALLWATETHGQAVVTQASAPGGLSTNQVPEAPGRKLSFEMPPIIVTGEREAELREEDKVGSYGQPRWTTTRRFPTSRVYIVPEGKAELEYWLRTTCEKDGSTSFRSLYEVEYGLPHRFQCDLYARTDRNTASGKTYFSEQYELRYALADWGVLPGNPTLYFEYIHQEDEDRPDQVEPKLLFGGELCPRWHWAVNFVGEFETSGELEREYSVRDGISYTLADSKFSVGAESQQFFTDTKENRGNFEDSVVLGPSFNYHPLPQLTINFAPLFGVTADSPKAQIWFNCGWEF